jgi:hypothetical protein
MTKKEPKNKKSQNLNSPKRNKTIADRVQLRFSQLDAKSSNISKQIDSLKKRIDNTSSLKLKVEKQN